MVISDEQLIRQYLDGDKKNFEEIVERYLKIIYNFVYRLIGNEKNAEDITQEIFLRVWKNIKKFDTKKSFKTWIFTIAKNASIDYLRKRKDIIMSTFDNEDGGNVVLDNIIDEELKPDEIFALAKDKKTVELAMDKISIVQKEIIVLKYMNEMSLFEIAEIMDIPLNTVKSHHRRALIKIRNVIDATKLSKTTY